jgi:hypothetical protein
MATIDVHGLSVIMRMAPFYACGCRETNFRSRICAEMPQKSVTLFLGAERQRGFAIAAGFG